MEAIFAKLCSEHSAHVTLVSVVSAMCAANSEQHSCVRLIYIILSCREGVLLMANASSPARIFAQLMSDS